MKQDSLKLANDILDNIKSDMGIRDAEVPPKVIKDLFSKFSFLDQDVINDIVDALASSQESDESQFAMESDADRLYEKYKKLDESVIMTSYFESIKTMSIKECHLNGRHFMSSNSSFIQNEYNSEYKLYRHIEKGKKIKG